jgi:hypothetical protein
MAHPSTTRFWIVFVAISLGLFAALTWSMRRAEWRAVAAMVNDRPGDRGGNLAEVASAIRRLNLVTVELITAVQSESTSESWRGDVHAAVSAPAVLHYGVDLSQLQTTRLGYSPSSSAYSLRVPVPKRLAIEVLGQEERHQVATGWLRSRALAGEFHLGLARKGLYESAEQLTLAADVATKVRQLTRDQVAGLVGRVVGQGVPVHVRFEDEP